MEARVCDRIVYIVKGINIFTKKRFLRGGGTPLF